MRHCRPEQRQTPAPTRGTDRLQAPLHKGHSHDQDPPPGHRGTHTRQDYTLLTRDTETGLDLVEELSWDTEDVVPQTTQETLFYQDLFPLNPLEIYLETIQRDEIEERTQRYESREILEKGIYYLLLIIYLYIL